MSRWAITGTTGFIGPKLCRLVCDRGDEVVALTRPGSSSSTTDLTGVRICPTDLLDVAAIRRAIRGCDVVVHLAAPRRLPGKSRGSAPGSRGFLVITEACRALLEAAAEVGASKFVLASSTSVYGRPWGEVTESSPLKPQSEYARARLTGERLSLSTGARVGVCVTIVRLSGVYGPGSIPLRPLLAKVTAGGFRVVGDGRQIHQTIHVEDAARALDASGRGGRTSSETVLVSGARSSLREWLDEMATAAGVSVRYTPWLGLPARLALRGVPGLIGSRRLASLDYQLRPRAYAIEHSLELFGNYHQVSLGDAMAELVGERHAALP